MTWNYRIIKYANNEGYGLHEVYYNKSGGIISYTKQPISFVCGPEEGSNGIIGSIEYALKNAKEQPILDEENIVFSFPTTE